MIKNIFTLSILVLFLAGCSSKNLSKSIYSSNEFYSNYNVTYQNNDIKLTKSYELLKSTIEEKFKKLHVKKGNDLNIKVSITNFDEGNRALRYIIGFGAGSAKAIIKTRFYNKSNTLLGEIETESNLYMGIFGGSSDKVFDLTAEKIVDFARENYLIARY